MFPVMAPREQEQVCASKLMTCRSASLRFAILWANPVCQFTTY